MSPIDKAISDVKRKIPRQILEAAFVEKRGFGPISRRTPVSIDYRIREEVIQSRVLEDVNLMGGKLTVVPLANVRPEYLPLNRTVWRVPMDLTENKRITRVLSITMSTGASVPMNTLYNNAASSYVDAAGGLLDAHKPIPNVSDGLVQLIGENTVMAQALYPPALSLYLRCMLENDEELNNLPTTAYHSFTQLVEYAVKSYVYNELIIDVDAARLVGGQELGAFLNILEGYSDAEELYTEFLRTKWAKVALLSDPESKKRHLSMMVGRR